MKCTVDPCNAPLEYKGGENREDYGCHNPKCHRFDIQYYGNLKVRNGWYYAAGYALPFQWINSTSYRWYALVGSPESNQTQLQGLRLFVDHDHGRMTWYDPEMDGHLNSHMMVNRKECSQVPLYAVPYVALPANDDFKSQFYILRDRVMHEWLRSRGLPTAVNPAYEHQNVERPITITLPLPPIRTVYGDQSSSTPPDTSDVTMRQLVSAALSRKSASDAMEVCRRLDHIQRTEHTNRYS